MTALPDVAAIHHFSLTVNDLEASEEWYGRVLGTTRAFVEEHPGGHAVVLNRPGTNVFFGLHHHDAHVSEPFSECRTGLDHVALHVAERDALDAWVDHLDALGVEHAPIVEKTDPFPFALVAFRDPDNIQLELIWS